MYSFIILDTKCNQNSVGGVLLLQTHIVVYNSNSNINVGVVI